jgi:hypothetical protein
MALVEIRISRWMCNERETVGVAKALGAFSAGAIRGDFVGDRVADSGGEYS